MTWFYSGRKAWRMSTETDPAALVAWLDEQGVDYVLVDRLDRDTTTTLDRVAPALRAFSERLTVVHTSPWGDLVLAVNHPRPTAEPPSP